MAPSPETTVVEPRERPRDIETKPIPANGPATAASIPPRGVTVSEAPDEKTNPTARAVATRYESAAAVSGSTESEAAFPTAIQTPHEAIVNDSNATAEWEGHLSARSPCDAKRLRSSQF